MMPLALGIDLGTSGVRIAVITEAGDLIHTEETGYRHGLVDPADWLHCCTTLIRAIPDSLRLRINALAIDGTSGTLLACDAGGEPLGAAGADFLGRLEDFQLEHEMGRPGTDQSTGNLDRDVCQRYCQRDVLFQVKRQGDRRIEVRAGYRSQHGDEDHQDRAGGNGIAEQGNGDISACQVLSHDA